jgi:hypothetical protein
MRTTSAGHSPVTGKKVILLLTEAWLDCLKAHAAGGSSCRSCLERVTDIRRVFAPGSRLAYSLDCTEQDARELLELAARHCPDAVPAIKETVERFGG